MAIVGGGNIYIFEDDRGFNYRGAWDVNQTYAANDMVYDGSTPTAYLAFTNIAAGVRPSTGGAGWARLGTRGTDGAQGPQGIGGQYTVWLFARSTNEPRQPDNSDIRYPATTMRSSNVWNIDISALSGNDPLWISWVRARPEQVPPDLEYGQVARLSGPQGPTGSTGPTGNSIQARYSPDGTSSWQTTPRSTDKYVQFRIGTTAPWLPSGGIKFVGDDGQQGMDGTDGDSLDIRFSPNSTGPWSSTASPADKYIQFRKGSEAWQPNPGIKFVGDDGQDGDDGDDSLEVQYASSNTDLSFHSELMSNDLYIRFRIGGTGAWSRGVRFVGRDGPAGDSVEFEFSADSNRWETTARSGDKYIRFRTGSSGPWSNAIKFVGDDGTAGGVGPRGESISIEYSIDGQAGWHAVLADTDYFIRLQVGTRGWSQGIRFRAYPVQIQYSIDGSTLWHATFVAGTDKYIRFSSNNGASWTAGDRFVGEDGTDGDHSLEVQYSQTGQTGTWHAVLALTDRFIRFRTGGMGGTWSTGIRFVGVTGGFQATLYQRSANQPTAPTNVTYNPTTIGNPYGGTIGSWVPTIPSGTDQLWRVNVTVPPALATGNLNVTVDSTVYTERGAAGAAGADGRFYDWVFRWSVNRPPDPTPTRYDGTRIHGLSDWFQPAPTATGSVGQFLWAAEIEIRGTTATYINTVRLSGPELPV